MKNTKRIIILGGGFAGVQCAQTLRRNLPATEAEITLFNTENHLVFTPLLADVIGASVNPLDVVVPLRQLLTGVSCRTEEILGVDQPSRTVEYRSSDGYSCHLTYDHLVLACGNLANLHAVPGMADHAFPLKNIGDAVALRSHIMEQMEKAETSCNPERRLSGRSGNSVRSGATRPWPSFSAPNFPDGPPGWPGAAFICSSCPPGPAVARWPSIGPGCSSSRAT